MAGSIAFFGDRAYAAMALAACRHCNGLWYAGDCLNAADWSNHGDTAIRAAFQNLMFCASTPALVDDVRVTSQLSQHFASKA